MAKVTIDKDVLNVNLSFLDSLLSFHGSFHIPLAHVTNAYVSDLEDLELQYDLKGTNWGLMKPAGVFVNPQGLIFVDVGQGDCLVIETRGERFSSNCGATFRRAIPTRSRITSCAPFRTADP